LKNVQTDKDSITIISAGAVIEGKLTSNGNIRIDGIINGNIDAHGNITVGEHGEINGEVKGKTITLGGKVFGSINASEKVLLEAKSILKGDLITKILVVEEGAVFDGTSKMNPILSKNDVSSNSELFKK